MKGIPKGNYPMFTCIMAALIEEGFRVVRGPDWCWGEQDGGEGNVGTVVEVKEENLERDGTVYGGTAVGVYWDNGTLSNYRCGFDGKYDVVVLDTAPAGSCHTSVFCRECHVTPVCGLRWKCSTCYDFDLCSQCYSDNKHSLEHRFHRYDTRHCESTSVSPRSGSRRVQAKGFFKGAVVSRGKDWCWGDQDGREDKTGVVQSLRDSEKESFRSVAEVQWRGSEAASSTNIYRVGHKGKVDLKCVTAGEGGHYYPQHLPMAECVEMRSAGDTAALKTPDSSSDGHQCLASTDASRLEKDPKSDSPSAAVTGDSRVGSPSATGTLLPAAVADEGRTEPLASLTNGTSGSLSTEGVGEGIQAEKRVLATTSNTITTDTNTTTSSTAEDITMAKDRSENLGGAVRAFQDGQVVRVTDDLTEMHRLQTERGGWNDDMACALGELGRVVKRQDGGLYLVRVSGYLWVVRPELLRPAPNEAPPDVPFVEQGNIAHRVISSGKTELLKELLLYRPDLANSWISSALGEIPAISSAILSTNVEMVRLLLEHNASCNIQDFCGSTPLHHACSIEFEEAIELLLDAGSDPTMVNLSSDTPLHSSSFSNCIVSCRLLLRRHPEHVDIRKPDGITALHFACMKGHHAIAKLLLETGADCNAVPCGKYTPLHFSADGNLANLVELLVGHGAKLSPIDERGFSPLHVILNHCLNFSPATCWTEVPELSKIRSTLSDVSAPLDGLAAVACLLAREGADLYCLDRSGQTPLQMCPDPVLPHLLRHSEERPSFYGTLAVPVQSSVSGIAPNSSVAPSTADSVAVATNSIAEVTTATTVAASTMEPRSSTSPAQALTRGSGLRGGEVVRVIEDLSELHKIQTKTAGWCDDMALCLGQLGRIMITTGPERDRHLVKVNGYLWMLAPEAFVPAPEEEPPDVPDALHTKTSYFAVLCDDAKQLRISLSLTHDLIQGDLGAMLIREAALRSSVDCLKVLLQEFKVNPNHLCSDGITALTFACDVKNSHFIEQLLEAGADPAIVDPRGFNALHSCAIKGCLRGCQLILEKHPSLLNVCKNDGYGPLHLACNGGHLEVVKYLVEHEMCDIDKVTIVLNTALQIALDRLFWGVAELLVGYGIDLNMPDDHSRTALSFAVKKKAPSIPSSSTPELDKIGSALWDVPLFMRGSAAMACLLVREGADLDHRFVDGSSVLDHCPGELQPHLLHYQHQSSTLHGKLRKYPKPTPAELSEETSWHAQRRSRLLKSLEEEETGPPLPDKESVPGEASLPLESSNKPLAEPTLPQSVEDVDSSEEATKGSNGKAAVGPFSSVQETKPASVVVESEKKVQLDSAALCLMCDDTIDVRIVPCGHAVLCRSHASSAKKCPQCKVAIQAIVGICAMCQERPCTVTLQPCEHTMCAVCASVMKRCFECKAVISSKDGLPEAADTNVDSAEVVDFDPDSLCSICCDSKKNTAFTCGHQLCYDCSLKVDLCPICREQIKFRIKLH